MAIVGFLCWVWPVALACNNGEVSYQGNCLASCPSATFQQNTDCIACISHCNFCSDDTQCTVCADTYYFYAGTCVDTCPPLYYPNVNRCDKCLENCGSCITGGQCSTCLPNLYLTSDLQCVVDCPPSYFKDGAICSECKQHCTVCSSSTTCTQCTNPYKLLNNECLNECLQNYFADAGLCKPCPQNCRVCENEQRCTTCATSYFIMPSFLCVQSCPAERYFVLGSNCRSCSSFCRVCQSAEVCGSCQTGYVRLVNFTCASQCPAGFFINLDSDCESCVQNCFACTSNNRCETCAAGYFLQLNRVCYNFCTKRSYQSGPVCLACLDSCQTCQSGSTCTTCQDGLVLLLSNQCAGACDPGSFSLNGFCKLCIDKCISCTDGVTCLVCAPDYLLNPTQKCILFTCPISFFKINMACYPCRNNCLQCQNYNVCNQCKSGFYMKNADCYPCMPFCESCLNEQICLLCQLKAFQYKGRCSTSCPYNFFPYNLTRVCLPCQANCPSDSIRFFFVAAQQFPGHINFLISYSGDLPFVISSFLNASTFGLNITRADGLTSALPIAALSLNPNLTITLTSTAYADKYSQGQNAFRLTLRIPQVLPFSEVFISKQPISLRMFKPDQLADRALTAHLYQRAGFWVSFVAFLLSLASSLLCHSVDRPFQLLQLSLMYSLCNPKLSNELKAYFKGASFFAFLRWDSPVLQLLPPSQTYLNFSQVGSANVIGAAGTTLLIYIICILSVFTLAMLHRRGAVTLPLPPAACLNSLASSCHRPSDYCLMSAIQTLLLMLLRTINFLITAARPVLVFCSVATLSAATRPEEIGVGVVVLTIVLLACGLGTWLEEEPARWRHCSDLGCDLLIALILQHGASLELAGLSLLALLGRDFFDLLLLYYRHPYALMHSAVLIVDYLSLLLLFYEGSKAGVLALQAVACTTRTAFGVAQLYYCQTAEEQARPNAQKWSTLSPAPNDKPEKDPQVLN